MKVEISDSVNVWKETGVKESLFSFVSSLKNSTSIPGEASPGCEGRGGHEGGAPPLICTPLPSERKRVDANMAASIQSVKKQTATERMPRVLMVPQMLANVELRPSLMSTRYAGRSGR